MSKQYGHEDLLAEFITRACISILPDKTTFNVDNVRVCKIVGAGLHNSQVVQGMVFKKSGEIELSYISFMLDCDMRGNKRLLASG